MSQCPVDHKLLAAQWDAQAESSAAAGRSPESSGSLPNTSSPLQILHFSL